MNLFKNVLAVGLLAITMVATGARPPVDRPWTEWAALVASGLLGLSIADTLLFEGLSRVGASRIAVVDTIYAPLIVTMSVLILGEQPTAAFLVGAAAVIGGIALATIRPGALSVESRAEWVGMAYGAAAIACTAAAVVIAKPALEHSDLVEVTLTRLVVGVVGQLIGITWTGRWREASVAFRPSPTHKTLLPAAFIGTYVSMMLWLGGYKWADASVAAVLNQMATVYILFLAWSVLGEKLRSAQVIGALVAAAGALWIVLSGP